MAENKDAEKQRILEEFARSNSSVENSDPAPTPELVYVDDGKIRSKGGRPVLDPARKWSKKERMEYIRERIAEGEETK